MGGVSSQFPVLHQSAAVAPGTLGVQHQDPFKLTQADLKTLVTDIHRELDTEMRGQNSELREMAKYYFDGQGKAIRPVIALCLGHAFKIILGQYSELRDMAKYYFEG